MAVTGVDFSDVGLDKARRLAEATGTRVEWVLADLRSYQPEEGAYDLVVVLYLHLPGDERRAVHGAVARALSPGGVVLVVGHDLTNLTHGYGGPPDPSILFTPDDVVADLAGLSIERAPARRAGGGDRRQRASRDRCPGTGRASLNRR